MSKAEHDPEARDRSQELPTGLLVSPEYAADPHAFHAPLRESGPVHRLPGFGGRDAFLVVDHEHGRAVLTDPRMAKDFRHAPVEFQGMFEEGSMVLAGNMLLKDPPDHTRLRRLVSGAFTPRRVESLEPRIQQITDGLIDAMEPKGRADLIQDFAFPLPIIVICELLGVPTDRASDFREWSQALITPPADADMERRRREGNDAFRAYFTRLIAERRAEPRDDMISALVAARDDDGLLSEQELLSTVLLLLIAGHETTVNLIGSGMAALLRHPDQLDLLQARPDLLPSAIEELLRFESPVERCTERIAVQDMEIAGTPIPKSSFVYVSIAAAGRDPRVFPEPDTLDITRADNRHVAFGHGVHFCLGAPLARLEGRIAFGTLLRRLPGIALDCAPDELRWRVSDAIVRALIALPVRF